MEFCFAGINKNKEIDMWTRFMDMHSGGGSKEAWENIYIEAEEEKAKVIFYNRFGHNPERVSCTCCGEDYSISESETLEQATGYERGCLWDDKEGGYVEKHGRSYIPYRTLIEYKKDSEVLFITDAEIKKSERTGDVPQEGYVWV
jgi:hypothetical protein